MTNPFLTTESLIKFIESLNISNEDRNELLERIPNLDEAGRVKLHSLLTDLHLLDKEEEEAVSRIQADLSS